MFYTNEELALYGYLTKAEMLALDPEPFSGYLSVDPTDPEQRISIFALVDWAVRQQEVSGLASLIQRLVEENQRLLTLQISPPSPPRDTTH